MATEKSKFQLKKGGDHNFDISKGGKRKFDLTKDEDDVVVTANTSSPADVSEPTSVHPDAEPNGNKKWLWIALAIIVIAIIAWLLIPSTKSTSEDTISAEETEVVTSANETDELNSEVTPATDETTDENEEVATADDSYSSDEQTPQGSNTDSAPTVPENANNVSEDVEKEALKVIRGDYGIGQERVNNLGSKYHAIQSRVNELKRQGAF
ncbi:MAG: hypothetical protein NC453_11075 [Muribaculum sp.]|nr:hypothetical protein [Muribaculum sp.]